MLDSVFCGTNVSSTARFKSSCVGMFLAGAKGHGSALSVISHEKSAQMPYHSVVNLLLDLSGRRVQFYNMQLL
jgi:hypothetical protein